MKKGAPYSRCARRRHGLIYRLLRPLAALILRLKFNFVAERVPKIRGNFIALANHNTNWDMIMLGVASPRPMYFVASEHIFYKGWISRLLVWAVAPIARVKGGVAASTVLYITRALRRGDNVCIFAEGNRSFGGTTCGILPSTGKLVKASGAAMVTYKLIGGYLTSPRWSVTERRGRMRGVVMHVYTPEQIKEMTADEVNRAIETDLWEDAYARQREENIRYKGKKLALGMECALYICPACGRMGQLSSQDDQIRCSCGLCMTYDQYGMLHGGEMQTITQWDEWQAEALKKGMESGELRDTEDEDIQVFELGSGILNRIHRGRIGLHGGVLHLGELKLAVKEIAGVGMYSRNRTVLTTGDGRHYELHGGQGFSGRKYMDMLKHYGVAAQY